MESSVSKVFYWVFLAYSIYQLVFCIGYENVDYFQLFWILCLVHVLDKLVNIYFKDEKENK